MLYAGYRSLVRYQDKNYILDNLIFVGRIIVLNKFVLSARCFLRLKTTQKTGLNAISSASVKCSPLTSYLEYTRKPAYRNNTFFVCHRPGPHKIFWGYLMPGVSDIIGLAVPHNTSRDPLQLLICHQYFLAALSQP